MTQNNTTQPQQALASPYAPDFADQLTQLQRTAPSRIRTPGALASNLLADALLHYGAKRAGAAANSSGTAPIDQVFAPYYAQPGLSPEQADRLFGPNLTVGGNP